MFTQNWNELEVTLSEPVKKVLRDTFGFHEMTPVQAACIPQFMGFKDVAVEAVTGSGKTIAFLVPLIEILLSKCETICPGRVYALIISPTRELTVEIFCELKKFIEELPQFSCQSFIGGSSIDTDTANISAGNVNIVVATPGRLHDLLSRKSTAKNLKSALKHLEVLVLDEADRLLDLGFERKLTEILLHCPKQRRTGLFSATQTSDVKNLIRAGLRNPVSIAVKEKHNPQRTPQSLRNFFIECSADKKSSILLKILEEQLSTSRKVMVFMSTCAMIEYFSLVFRSFLDATAVFSIHGKMRKKRISVFKRFRQGSSGVLLCTDVMARGIDISDIDMVIQYDPPSSAEAFVHRCGRTARIGHTGEAVIMLLSSELDYVRFLQINQRVELTRRSAPTTDALTEPLRQLQLADRANMIAANRAFVSFIQSYAKHECRLIFQLKELDLAGVALSFGLLQMPRMPELRNRCVQAFTPVHVNINEIAFSNPKKEAVRQEKLCSYRSTGVWPGLKQPRPKPWSEAKKKRQEKGAKRKRRAASRSEQRDNGSMDPAEWADMAEDMKLLKKFKKGKMSESKLDQAFGLD